MGRGKSGPADVDDVLAELERRGGVLAGELPAPLFAADLVAEGFPVLHDLDALDRLLPGDPHRIGDELVLAQGLVDQNRVFSGADPDDDGRIADPLSGKVLD